MDRRKVFPDSLFFAINGERWDSNYFILEAINQGAAGIVTENKISGTNQTPIIEVQGIREVMGQVSKRFYHQPDETFKLIGVTGTNDKTTVTSIIRDPYKLIVFNVGLIGTINYDLVFRVLPSMKITS